MSIAFICADGNGKPISSVLPQLLVFMGVTAAISFAVARFVRTLPLAVISSIAVTDLVFVLMLLLPELLSPSRDKHEHNEMLFLWPIVLVVFTAPMVGLASIGFVRFANRFWRGRTLATKTAN